MPMSYEVFVNGKRQAATYDHGFALCIAELYFLAGFDVEIIHIYF